MTRRARPNAGGSRSPGSNALLAEVDEFTEGVVDDAMTAQGGTVLRRSADDVLAEIEAAQEAAEEAQRQVRKKAREGKKAELHEKYEERKTRLREKLHISLISRASFRSRKPQSHSGSAALPMGDTSPSPTFWRPQIPLLAAAVSGTA